MFVSTKILKALLRGWLMRVPRAKERTLLVRRWRTLSARERKGEKIDSGGAVIWGKHENVKRLRELKQVADKNTQG